MKTTPKSEIFPRAGILQNRSLKAETRRTPPARLFAATLLVALSWFALAPGAAAQTDAVTISLDEFQRMVYSAHLLTQLDEKPELDGSLQVLLELQRRNPHTDPTALAELTRQALQRYRTNAPAYIRHYGSRDEILAAYLDALRQLPARTNFIPAHLSLLNTLITRAQAPTGEPQADLIHSGSQRLLTAADTPGQRRQLLDACTARAQGNAAFRVAMDSLLLPETLVSLGSTPAEIIGNTNSALHANVTMQTLLVLSATNGGRLTISSNQLRNLFSSETQSLWEIVHTNLALRLEFNQSQPDLLAYLTNQAALDDWDQRQTAVTRGQARRIASSTAAILVQSQLAASPSSPTPDWWAPVGDLVGGIASFAVSGDPGSFISGFFGLIGLASDTESSDDQILREIGNVQTLLGDLSTNMNYRFDRVDQSLIQIYDTLNEQFDQIKITLDLQGRQIAHLSGDVNAVRLSLLDVETDLSRVERNLATFHALDWRFDLLEHMNYVRGFEARAGHPLPYTDNAPSDFLSYENAFYTHAFDRAASETLSRYATLPFGDGEFYAQLSASGGTNVYAETLNYIRKCLRQRLGLAGFPELPLLANPQDWSAGASAWLQLAFESPGSFRRYERGVGRPSRLDGIISKGNDLASFSRSLSFTGTNVNRPLYLALESFYAGKLVIFTNQVQSAERQYAADRGFALDTWRRWTLAAPRMTVTNTELIQTPGMSLPAIPSDATNVIAIASGYRHNLALRSSGTVAAWGDNTFGQVSRAVTVSNVVRIAAGANHNLALRADGTVIGWGDNIYGQAAGTNAGNNVLAIAAGSGHSLALRTDGTVLGWGRNQAGQAIGLPTANTTPPGIVTVGGKTLTNVVAIKGGSFFSVALKADGTVVAWGANTDGQLNIPAGATNIVAIAAGDSHCAALKANGSVIGWGANGSGEATPPVSATNVVAIAAGGHHTLALRADGTVVAWGMNNLGQTNLPARATNVVALSGGEYHTLFLTATGTTAPVGSGGPWFTRADIPAGVGYLFSAVNASVLTNFSLDLHGIVVELSGAKALLQAVLELGLSHTLQRDDLLHGFLYGSESLVDLEASRTFFESENAKLLQRPDTKPQMLTEVARLRYARFVERLEARLNDLAATGQPELPRLVEHTSRLLNLLRDAWATVPQPALEIGRETNQLGLVLFGEPFAHYALQSCTNLNTPGWSTVTATNLHSEERVTQPVPGDPRHFFRATLP